MKLERQNKKNPQRWHADVANILSLGLLEGQERKWAETELLVQNKWWGYT